MEATKEVVLSSKRKVKIRTWPMRPSLTHAEFVREICQKLVEQMKLGETLLSQVKVEDVKLNEILGVARELFASDPERVFKFIQDGCELPADELEKLNLSETLELAWEVGFFNLRPIQGLFERLRKSDGKSTPQRRS